MRRTKAAELAALCHRWAEHSIDVACGSSRELGAATGNVCTRNLPLPGKGTAGGHLASLADGRHMGLSVKLSLICLLCSSMLNSSSRRHSRKAKRRSSSSLLQAPRQTSSSA